MIYLTGLLGVARVGIDTTIAKRREVLDKAPKDRKEREAHHKDTIVVSDEALKRHDGERLVVGDDDRWTGFTAQAVVDALRAAVVRLELNIEVETVVFARYVWGTRTTPTKASSRHVFGADRGIEAPPKGEQGVQEGRPPSASCIASRSTAKPTLSRTIFMEGPSCRRSTSRRTRRQTAEAYQAGKMDRCAP